MNTKQKIALWLGIVAFVLMGLFPPWNYPGSVLGVKIQIDKGYKAIFAPPTGKGEEGKMFGASIDINRLCVQWAMIAVITGGLLITFSGKQKA